MDIIKWYGIGEHLWQSHYGDYNVALNNPGSGGNKTW